jgi:hypothetical protein
MKTWRIFVAMIVLGVVVEVLSPIFSAKTGIIIPLIQNNCGAVPVFVQDIMMVNSEPDPRYWRGFMTCGIGVIGFIMMPGFLKVLVWLYHFVHPQSSNFQPE